MSEKKAKTYTAEFKESAVKLAVESDKPATETARELGVNVNSLHTWIAKYHRPKAASKPQKNDEHIYDELKRLRKEMGSSQQRYRTRHRELRRVLDLSGFFVLWQPPKIYSVLGS